MILSFLNESEKHSMKMLAIKKSVMQVTLVPSILILNLAVLSGCSMVTNSVDTVGQGVVSVGDYVQSVTGKVQAQKLEDERFLLSEIYYEPVTTFDSWSMRAKARELCPKGYIYLSRQARKQAEFAYSHEQCSGEKACGYHLEWQIKCEKVPYEPFTLFGKT